MFQLLYDRQHNVLLTRLSGVYVEEDIVLRDKQVARFVAQHGLARGLTDFTDVTAIDIPMEIVVRRAHAPPMLAGQTRIIVAPGEPSYSFNRIVAAHQYYSWKVEPLVVDSLQQGYHALGDAPFNFLPVEEDARARFDRIGLGVLKQIDWRARRETETRQATMAKRVGDTSWRGITLSDLLNTGLQHVRLSDADLTVECPHCRLQASLADCEVSSGRRTAYSCAKCTTVLIQLSPVSKDLPGQAAGYCFGGFLVKTTAEIRYQTVVIPRSWS